VADYTTDALIASIKRRASMPNSQSLFGDDVIVKIATDELWDTVVPFLMSNREEYLVKVKYVELVAGEDTIDIPSGAVGMKLRDISVVTNANTISESFWGLPRIEPDQISTGYTAYRSGFYVQANQIILWPNPNVAQTLRMTYFRRPNELVETTDCGQVTSIDTGLNTLTLGNVPVSWTAGTRIDVISNVPGFDTVFEDLTLVTASSPTVELADVTGISVGDWICITGESCIPQVPLECHQLLAQASVVKCLESLKDTEGMQLAQAKLSEMFKAFENMTTPRVDGRPKVINRQNGVFLSSRRGWWW
jgi:hypothetical protein